MKGQENRMSTALIFGLRFKYLTIHTRILYITVFSFVHKTALSWYSNRQRVKERQLLGQTQQMSDIEKLTQTNIHIANVTSYS